MRYKISLLLALAVGCTGSIAEPEHTQEFERRPDDPLNPNVNPESLLEKFDCDGQAPSAPLASTSRLTTGEYNLTVQALFQTEDRPADDFAPDTNSEGFRVGDSISDRHVEDYQSTAKILVEQYLDRVLPCPVAEGEACVRSFIRTFGLKLFRRPVSDEQEERLVTLYRAAENNQEGFEYVARAMLGSPSFIYHSRFADTGEDVSKLDSYSLASKIAFFLWSAAPNDEVMSVAAQGALSDPAEVEMLTRDMLDDPAMNEGLRNFFRQWFHIESLESSPKEADIYPMWNEAFRKDLMESFDLFVVEVMTEHEGSLTTLLTGDFAYVNERLAPLYGLDGIEGNELRRVQLSDSHRAGVLTHPAIMAKYGTNHGSAPVQRGVWVLENLFCLTPAPPPDDVDTDVSTVPEPGKTTREKFEQHSSDPACAGCHQLIDPLGMSFEHYDGVGAWRAEDQGVAVDATGGIPDAFGGRTVADAVELGTALAESPDVAACVVEKMFQFATKRLNKVEDRCTILRLRKNFDESDHNLNELMVAIAKSESFRYLNQGAEQ